MTQPTPAEARERWRSWAQGTLGGSPAQIEAATQAAMAAMASGASQEQVIARARAAWSSGGTQAATATGAAVRQTPQTQPPARPSPSPLSVSPPTRRGYIRGRVAGFQPRNEQMGRRYVTVWDFRVERQDGGRPLPAVAVEMRGYSFEGAFNNGDEIEFKGNPRGSQVQHVRAAENLTSNSLVRVKRGPPRGVFRALTTGTRVLVKTVFILIWLGVAGAIVYFALHQFHKV